MDRLAQIEAARLYVHALNILLKAHGESYRAKGAITVTRVNGHVVIAIPEASPDCKPPIVNM